MFSVFLGTEPLTESEYVSIIHKAGDINEGPDIEPTNRKSRVDASRAYVPHPILRRRRTDLDSHASTIVIWKRGGREQMSFSN